MFSYIFMLIIRKPYSLEDFEEYYSLRYNVLRKPWNQKVGSEKDNFEFEAFHLIAVYNDIKKNNNDNNDTHKIVGVVRSHFVSEENAVQIRYMAVDKNFRNRKIGFFLLKSLEFLSPFNIKNFFLNSRFNAVKFYEKQGYKIVRETKPLFNIKHFRMEKKL